MTERTVRQLVLDEKSSRTTALPLLAGSGQRDGCRDGLASTTASFSQPTGIAADGETIIVCDTGCGAIRIITDLQPLANFLQHARLVFDGFGVRLRNDRPVQCALVQTLSNLRTAADYYSRQANALRQRLKLALCNGSDGSISADVQGSLQIMLEVLEALSSRLQSIGGAGATAAVNPHALTTLALERFFALIRNNTQCPTVLDFSRIRAAATRELIKQVTVCDFTYPSSRRSFYPDPARGLRFSQLRFPKREALYRTPPQLTTQESVTLADYAKTFFRPAPQNTVRAFSKFAPGTLPVNTFEHRVTLQVEPLNLEERSRQVIEGKEPATRILGAVPEPKAAKDGEPTVFLGVKAGSQPKELQADSLFIVSTAAEFFHDARYGTFNGRWYAISTRGPCLFRYMATAPLRREAVLAEIDCTPFVDGGDEYVSVAEQELHGLLLKCRSGDGGDLDALPDHDAGVEDDAFSYFGLSQQTASQEDDRDQRVHRRSSSKNNSRPKAKAKSKPKAAAKGGARAR